MIDFHGDEAKNKFIFWKKKFKMAAFKKGHFPAVPILNIFCENFIGLVELIDTKGIDVAQPILASGCPT